MLSPGSCTQCSHGKWSSSTWKHQWADMDWNPFLAQGRESQSKQNEAKEVSMAVTGKLPHCWALTTSRCTGEMDWSIRASVLAEARGSSGDLVRCQVACVKGQPKSWPNIISGCCQECVWKKLTFESVEREDCGPSSVKKPRKGRATHLHLPLRAEFGFSNLWTLDSNLKSPEFLGF